MTNWAVLEMALAHCSCHRASHDRTVPWSPFKCFSSMVQLRWGQRSILPTRRHLISHCCSDLRHMFKPRDEMVITEELFWDNLFLIRVVDLYLYSSFLVLSFISLSQQRLHPPETIQGSFYIREDCLLNQHQMFKWFWYKDTVSIHTDHLLLFIFLLLSCNFMSTVCVEWCLFCSSNCAGNQLHFGI